MSDDASAPSNIASVSASIAAQLTERRSMAITASGVSIAIFNTGQELFAVENRCPHQGAPLVGAPFVGPDRVRCMLHGWILNLKSCEAIDGLKRFPVKRCDDGRIEVAVEP